MDEATRKILLGITCILDDLRYEICANTSASILNTNYIKERIDYTQEILKSIEIKKDTP